MANEYFRSLFLPSLNGQHKLWKNVLGREASVSDEVIQFGNLVGIDDYARDSEKFGANSSMLKYIMIFRSTQEKWTQLVGPNEIIALNTPHEWTNQTSRKILRDSWVGDIRRMAVASTSKGRLVTHGGLTYGEWLSLGRPQTAHKTAELLNNKYMKTLYQGECFNLGNPPNYGANPIWAHPFHELIPSWITTTEVLPFDQLHGSGSLNTMQGRAAVDESLSLKYIDKLHYRRWGSIEIIRGQKITSIDLNLPDELLSQLPRDKQIYVERTNIEAMAK